MSKKEPLKFINDFIVKLEEKEWIKRTPAFLHDYEKDYPYFKELEDNYEIVQKECMALLNYKEELKDVDGFAGEQSKGGIHAIKWKSFMFLSGSFVEENCELCPKTARLLKQIPNIKQAFFSILDPQQYIKPHRGYFQGFLRYHLGVIIPNNNKEKQCWIRINDDPIDNKKYDKNSIEKGEKYYWKNGEGIIFNDNYLHDAANYTDDIRVVLFIDVDRKFPKPIEWLFKFLLYLLYKTKPVKAIAEKAKVSLSNNPNK
tara:strand:+ start:20114 stop:20887 length:774 start_codon:yes stop_codon:yes gene_type:complete